MKSNSPDANISLFQNITNWVKNTPERAINDAFEAAVSIKRLEEENFNGNRVANDGTFGQSVFSVFEIQLQKYLEYINARLKFYKFSAKLTDLQARPDLPQANNAIAKLTVNQQTNDPVSRGQLSANQLAGNSRRFSLYQKLAFIDYTLERYNKVSDRTIDITADTSRNSATGLTRDNPAAQEDEKFQLFKSDRAKSYRQTRQPVTPIEKSILPGSFLKAFDRVKRNLSDSYTEYERDIVEELRQSRQRINKAIRYIILLIIAVLAVQILSKTLIYSPMINSFVDNKTMAVRFSPAIEERAFAELRAAKEKIEFDFMIKSIMREQSESHGLRDITQEKVTEPPIAEQENKARSPEESLEALIREESLTILRKYNAESLNGVKNLLADITAAFVFYLFLLSGRQELITIKEFLDEFLYSLNDNAKAFLIIISTDTFVGFHSSEGWDALLTLIFQHFGLPENKILAQSFISTVPVFLDGLFKFWIFQYLTQASPATATIYREMNE
ncbi:hypothetical protein H6F44_18625 [Pseudanabaena sp. FACHB-1277]|uniref:Proton extrusion protein PcxA n=1 Tax=Pseudanabaena cinerea FACHB-1277 TaxID=2949581 RepID=A0A926Z9S1_9CYAN|nr:hypothetical protein [Pseudanabaena cinerea]MBD2152119.1 hypothetical protein [Pseudanabaena cinerea FACHB-1277]